MTTPSRACNNPHPHPPLPPPPLPPPLPGLLQGLWPWPARDRGQLCHLSLPYALGGLRVLLPNLAHHLRLRLEDLCACAGRTRPRTPDWLRSTCRASTTCTSRRMHVPQLCGRALVRHRQSLGDKLEKPRTWSARAACDCGRCSRLPCLAAGGRRASIPWQPSRPTRPWDPGVSTRRKAVVGGFPLAFHRQSWHLLQGPQREAGFQEDPVDLGTMGFRADAEQWWTTPRPWNQSMPTQEHLFLGLEPASCPGRNVLFLDLRMWPCQGTSAGSPLEPVHLPASPRLVPRSPRVQMAGLTGTDSKENFPTLSGQGTVLCPAATVLTVYLHQGPW